jgi:cell division protein FtsL
MKLAAVLMLLTGIVLGIASSSIYHKIKAYKVNSEMFSAGAKEVIEN